MNWQGHYLNGKSADRQQVTVGVTATGLEIVTNDAVLRRWPFGEIRQTQGRYAGEPVRLERGGVASEVLIINNPHFLTTVRESAGDYRKRFHDPSRRRLRPALTLAAGLAAVGLAAGLYLWGIPALALVATPLVPATWEARLGDEILKNFVKPGDRCADPERQQILDGIVARLAADGAAGPYQLRLTVVDWAQVNAFALPGGHIVLLRGLLDRTESPEMLAGVLAHEIQHIVRRHTTRALIQHASTGLMVAAVAGDVSGLVAFALEGARVVGALNYSRYAEEEADAEGMRMLIRAQIDPAGMIAFFDRVVRKKDAEEQEGGVWRYLTTHPSTTQRVTNLKMLAVNAPIGPPLLAGRDWKDVRRVCGG
jgi:predicted Zn-dependent protease